MAYPRLHGGWECRQEELLLHPPRLHQLLQSFQQTWNATKSQKQCLDSSSGASCLSWNASWRINRSVPFCKHSRHGWWSLAKDVQRRKEVWFQCVGLCAWHGRGPFFVGWNRQSWLKVFSVSDITQHAHQPSETANPTCWPKRKSQAEKEKTWRTATYFVFAVGSNKKSLKPNTMGNCSPCFLYLQHTISSTEHIKESTGKIPKTNICYKLIDIRTYHTTSFPALSSGTEQYTLNAPPFSTNPSSFTPSVSWIVISNDKLPERNRKQVFVSRCHHCCDSPPKSSGAWLAEAEMSIAYLASGSSSHLKLHFPYFLLMIPVSDLLCLL